MFKPFNSTSQADFAGCTSMPAACSCSEMNTAIIMDITLVMSFFVIFLKSIIICICSIISPVIIINLVIIINIIINVFINIRKNERLKELSCI